MFSVKKVSSSVEKFVATGGVVTKIKKRKKKDETGVILGSSLVINSSPRNYS